MFRGLFALLSLLQGTLGADYDAQNIFARQITITRGQCVCLPSNVGIAASSAVVPVVFVTLIPIETTISGSATATVITRSGTELVTTAVGNSNGLDIAQTPTVTVQATLVSGIQQLAPGFTQTVIEVNIGINIAITIVVPSVQSPAAISTISSNGASVTVAPVSQTSSSIPVVPVSQGSGSMTVAPISQSIFFPNSTSSTSSSLITPTSSFSSSTTASASVTALNQAAILAALRAASATGFCSTLLGYSQSTATVQAIRSITSNELDTQSQTSTTTFVSTSLALFSTSTTRTTTTSTSTSFTSSTVIAITLTSVSTSSTLVRPMKRQLSFPTPTAIVGADPLLVSGACSEYVASPTASTSIQTTTFTNRLTSTTIDRTTSTHSSTATSTSTASFTSQETDTSTITIGTTTTSRSTTTTSTTTVTSQTCVASPLLNPSFESGVLTPWKCRAQQAGNVCQIDGPNALKSANGLYSVLGSIGNGTSINLQLSQTFNPPRGPYCPGTYSFNYEIAPIARSVSEIGSSNSQCLVSGAVYGAAGSNDFSGTYDSQYAADSAIITYQQSPTLVIDLAAGTDWNFSFYISCNFAASAVRVDNFILSLN